MPCGIEHRWQRRLATLTKALGEHKKAAQTIRRGTCWLQGRAEQQYWNLCEDDREYDMDEWPGRSAVGDVGYRLGGLSWTQMRVISWRLHLVFLVVGDTDLHWLASCECGLG